jgi:hypothetical protein
MLIDLDRNDIGNLIAALNTIAVKGKPSMMAVLQLIGKLEVALKDSGEETLEPAPVAEV